MKRTFIAMVVGISTLLTTFAFAGNEGIASKLAEASSPANVKAVALQQKKAYCTQNAKNKALQGSEKESYLTACMNHNEAQVQYALVNRGMESQNTGTAASDFNKTLQQAPTAAGEK